MPLVKPVMVELLLSVKLPTPELVRLKAGPAVVVIEKPDAVLTLKGTPGLNDCVVVSAPEQT